MIIKRSLFELEGEDYNKGNVNMSTIFFAVFLIPQIAFYFFLNRVMEERACLPRIMKILLVLSLVWLTFIHPFLGLASILKISFEDLQCRFGVDLIQIDHFIKFCSVFVVAVVFLGYLISERSFTHIESWTQVF